MSDGHVKPLHPWHTRLYRLARLDYLKILRTHGAPAQVARGVGYGIFVELIFFPTMGLGFFLIYPINKYLKGHLAASIAGFVFSKLSENIQKIIKCAINCQNQNLFVQFLVKDVLLDFLVHKVTIYFVSKDF